MTEKLTKALEKLIKCRSILVLSAGFFGVLALHLKFKCADKILFSGKPLTTMAVDGVHLFYSTEFVLRITEAQLVGVLVHEVFHCSHRHFGRLMGRDAYMWNVAGDLIINLVVIDSGYQLPGKPRTLDEMLVPGTEGYFFDKQFKDWSTEEVYKFVKKRFDDEAKKKGQGKPDGQPGIDPGGCGGVIEPQPGEDGETVDQDKIDHQWETIVRSALETARMNNEGNVPGHLQELHAQLQKPRVNWNQQIRRWADQSMRKEVTWQKPNKRFLHMGLYLPGTKSNGISHLVLGIDSSGSMDQELLEVEVASEVGALLDQGFCDKITVIYADTKVGVVDVFISGDVFKLAAPPRGGTDFRDTFRYINEHCSDASGVIYFSDMYVSEYGEAPACPVLWATCGREKNFTSQAAKIPFGDVIHVH